MPNIKGGKNYKKGKKGKGKTTGKKTETPYADLPDQLYAQVKSKLGGDRLDVECSDGVSRQAIIPGSFYKRVWINKLDILLVQLNEMNNKEVFILYKYDPNEAHSLKSQGLLKFDIGGIADEDSNIKFGNEDDSEDEDQDNVQDEVDKAHNETKNAESKASKNENEDEINSEELTPIAKKQKLKDSNIKRQNDRKGKYKNNDNDNDDIDIDAI